jgi:hypothetical protein
MAGSEANAAAASSRLRDAREEMTKLTERKRKAFESSVEVATVQVGIQEKSDASRAARSAALELLKKKPNYAAAMAELAAAQSALDAAIAASAEQSRRAELSGVVMKKSNAVTRLETEALQNDPEYAAVERDLAAARTALNKLRSDFVAQLPEDPDIAAKQREIDDLEASMDAWKARAETLGDNRPRRRGGVR